MCSRRHDFTKAAAEARCFNCGSQSHRQDACKRPKGDGKVKSSSEEPSAPRGESAGSGTPGNASGGFQAKAGSDKGGQGGKGSGIKGEKGTQPEIRQATADGPTVAAASAGDSTSGQQATLQAQGSQQEFFQEAAKLLKGFRIAHFKVEGQEDVQVGDAEAYVREVQQVQGCSEMRGLLDGGATHALRTARNADELRGSTLSKVSLALGSTELHLSPVGTLLSKEKVAPIAPMGALTSELGCTVTWKGDTCEVIHPRRGKLPVLMHNRCQELDAETTEELIRELEDKRARWMQRALSLRAMTSMGEQGSRSHLLEGDPDGQLLRWLQKWVRSVLKESWLECRLAGTKK